jgi:ABC-2 type transport system permease protein
MCGVTLLWELARKDMQLFLADRRGVLLCFAVPILLGSVFGSIFQRPASGSFARLPLQLVVEDDSPVTRRIVEGLQTSERLEIRRTDRAGALKRLGSDNGGVVLILPAGFGRLTDLHRPPGEPLPRIELLHHPASTVQSSLAEGLFTEIALREAAGVILAPLLPSGRKESWQRPFRVERTSLSGPMPDSIICYSHSFCGMSLQYLLFWGMDSGLLLLRERRQGIWRRLRTAPVSLGVLLGGKVLATTLVALLQIVFTFTFARLVFGVTVNGSLIGFGLMALTAALLSAATGLLVAGLGGNEGRARSIAILMILTLSMLGGLWLPSFLLPTWVQQASILFPTTWAVRGLEGVTWQGMGVGPASLCAGMLLGFCGLFLGAAWYCFAGSEARLNQEGGCT